MLGRIIGICSIVAVLLLTILLQMTNPTASGPLGILTVFILMYVSALGVLTFLLFLGSRVLAKVSRSLTVKRPFEPFSLGRAYYFSSVLALVPIMFIGMQSVGNIGFYDVVLVVLFAIIACIYIVKRTN